MNSITSFKAMKCYVRGFVTLCKLYAKSGRHTPQHNRHPHIGTNVHHKYGEHISGSVIGFTHSSFTKLAKINASFRFMFHTEESPHPQIPNLIPNGACFRCLLPPILFICLIGLDHFNNVNL